MILYCSAKLARELYDHFFDTDIPTLVADMEKNTPKRFHRMNAALANVVRLLRPFSLFFHCCYLCPHPSQIDEYSMVSFIPLNPHDEDSVALLLQHIDNSIQYGEDEEPVEPKDNEGYL